MVAHVSFDQHRTAVVGGRPRPGEHIHVVHGRLVGVGELDDAAEQDVVPVDTDADVGLPPDGHGGDSVEGGRLFGERRTLAAGDGHVGEGEPVVGLFVALFEVQIRVVGGGEQGNTEEDGESDAQVLPALPGEITAGLAAEHAHQVTRSTGSGSAIRWSSATRPSRRWTTRSAIAPMAEL